MALDMLFATPASPPDTTIDELGFNPSTTPSCLSPGSISGCFRQATPLPPPNKPPDAEDWITYRSVILDLYITLNLPLPAVRERMNESYGFVATEKMYKDRFKKWGAQKNYTQDDVDDFLATVSQNDFKATIHNRPVRWDRIKRRLGTGLPDYGIPKPSKAPQPTVPARKRASSASLLTNSAQHRSPGNAAAQIKTRQRASSFDDPSPSQACETATLSLAPSIIRGPSSALSIYTGCRAFSLLQIYLEERLFSADLLEQFFGPVEAFVGDQAAANRHLWLPHPSSLNQNYARGVALLRDNRVKLASTLLAQASGALEHLVVVHHPAFASCFLDAFVESKYEIPQGMSGYVRDLAVKASLKALGADHPITVLCRFVQGPANDDEQMEQLLFFCAKFCQLFSDRLGKQHKISAHVNLKHFAKLLQLERLEEAHTHFTEYVEPAFTDLLAGGVPRAMRAACLCYLRRKAHLLSSVGDHNGAETALHQCVDYAMDWLAERNISVAGNPLMEECFRLIDEIGEWTFSNGHTGKGIDLHSFAIGLCAAVRGEREGKAIRMISGQLARYSAAGYHDRVRIMQVRFPNVFADESDGLSEPTDHILPCPTCANGPDTQLWCEEHRMQEHVTTQDKVFVRLTRECLADLLKWFGMVGD